MAMKGYINSTYKIKVVIPVLKHESSVLYSMGFLFHASYCCDINTDTFIIIKEVADVLAIIVHRLHCIINSLVTNLSVTNI